MTPFRRLTALRPRPFHPDAPCGSAAETLEPRTLLTRFLVTTAADVVAADGLLSLREALTAANTDAAFSDAAAGTGDDRVVFAGHLAGGRFETRGTLAVTDSVIVDGGGIRLESVTRGGPVLNVRLDGAGRVLLRDLTIAGGDAADGGAGVRFVGGSTQSALGLADVTLAGNRAAGDGGGLLLVGGRLAATRTRFVGNRAVGGRGGGLHAVGADVRVTDAVFAGNRATGSGGGLSVSGGYASLEDTDLERNVTGADGGAVAANDRAFLRVGRGTLADNRAAGSGGAAAVADDATLALADDRVTANVAAGRGGGGVFAGGGSIRVARTSFGGNAAVGSDGLGGGLLLAGGAANLRDVDFRVNTAASGGGGVAVSGPSDPNAPPAVFAAADVEFARNAAGSGDAHAAAAGLGGGLLVDRSAGDARVSLTRGRFLRNRAAWGGGGLWVAAGRTALSGTDLRENVASAAAGFYADAALTLADLDLRGNRAAGDLRPGDGGAGTIDAAGTVTVRDARVLRNDATGAGGGFHNRGRLDLHRVQVVHNSAGDRGLFGHTGGGLFNAFGAVTLAEASQFAGNTTAGGEPDQIDGRGTLLDGREETRAPSLRLTSPAAGQIYQRDGADVADLAVTGVYTGPASAVYARWGDGPFTLLDADPAGGLFAGVLRGRPVGQETLEVRFGDRPGVTASADDVGVGDVFLVVGQSNAEGRADRLYVSSHPRWRAAEFDFFETWGDLRDTSVWPGLADRVMAAEDVPVAMVQSTPVGAPAAGPRAYWGAAGGVYFAGATRRVAESGVNAVKAVFWLQGEADVLAGTTRGEYRVGLSAIAGRFADALPGRPPLVAAQLGDLLDEDTTAVRLGQSDAWDAAPHVLAGPSLYDVPLTSDGIHFRFPDEIRTVAERWHAAVDRHVYGGPSARGPRLVSADLTSGRRGVLLRFDRDLAVGRDAARDGFDAFTATLDGVGREVAAAEIRDERTVLLTLADPVFAGDLRVSLGVGPRTGGSVVPVARRGDVLLPAEVFLERVVTV